MNKKISNVEKQAILQVLGNLISNVGNPYLKGLLLDLFLAIQNKTVNTLDIKFLDLFTYEIIKDDYHIIKDMLILYCRYFGINKYNDIINPIRVNNGLGFDDTFLRTLLKDLNKNKSFNNNLRLLGLLNLLNDNNLIYNNVGLRILISEYLSSINIDDLKSFKLDNIRLNDDYSFLVFKNDKKVNYTKLYFIKNDIILSTLLDDNIVNYVLTLNEDIKYFYGGNNEISKKINEISTNEIKKYQYEYKDNNIYNIVKYLYWCILKVKYGNNIYDYYSYEDIIVNEDNLYKEYISYFNKNYIKYIQVDDNLLSMYNKIIDTLNNEDDFYSNDLNKESIKRLDNEDYFKYEINLNDYFLNP